MANKVEFQDFSPQVKAKLKSIGNNWLNEWSQEIASHAKRNCSMPDDAGVQLRRSYRADVDEDEGEAMIGSDLESAYWEEYGTGEYADTSKNGGIDGRIPWWVYVRNSPNRDVRPRDLKPHYTQLQAEAIAESMRAEGIDAHATSGRPAQYTLEKAFTANRQSAMDDIESKLKGLKG